MEAFGKEIQIKRFGCNCLDEPGQPIDPSVNWFVDYNYEHFDDLAPIM